MMREAEKQAIRQEIELLKEQGARRQVLSLHACHRLFFDFGIKPSVVSVRELTAVGSAGDIPRDIETFWQQIRQASRVRIGQGAIPESLEGAAGELLGALYQSALENAKKGLDDERAALIHQAQEVERRARDAELRLAMALDAAREAQVGFAEAVTRREQAEMQLAALRGEQAARADHSDSSRRQLSTELESLRRQLDERDVQLATLQRQSDELRAQAQLNAEIYANQLKDAIDDAQRRVRPMLVELDALRAQASTYQAGIKEASRREFDFMQQLSTVKGRADALEKLANRQADELAGLHRELAKAGENRGVDPVVAQWVADLAARDVLASADLARLGRSVDAFVAIPRHCVACGDGEPELADINGQIEVACPECGRSSGWSQSRLEACRKFSFGA